MLVWGNSWIPLLGKGQTSLVEEWVRFGADSWRGREGVQQNCCGKWVGRGIRDCWSPSGSAEIQNLIIKRSYLLVKGTQGR